MHSLPTIRITTAPRAVSATLDNTPNEIMERHEDDYGRIARAIAYLDSRQDEQPSLDDVAAHVGLSAFHFQRLFRRWAGVSPKRFLQALTAESAKRLLRAGASVLDSAYGSGLSGPGRLHDLLVAFEAMTPGEYKRHGEDLDIRYGFHPTPFGDALIGATDRGVCGLVFVADAASNGGDADVRRQALDDLVGRWPGARFVEDSTATAPLVSHMFGTDPEPDSEPAPKRRPIHLLVRGTNFQVQVWQALLSVPAGSFVTYGDLAAAIGKPKAARAVGSAVGANPIGFLIPCHRVIRQTGALGGYRWGTERKRVLHAWEALRLPDGAVV